MSIQLSTLGLISVPSSIYTRKSINHFALSCNTRFSLCNALGSKISAAVKKKDHVKNTRHALKQVVTKCSKKYIYTSQLSGKEDFSLDREFKENDLWKKYIEVYSVLKSEILNDLAFEWTDDSRKWVLQMLEYNVPTGEYGPVGFSVVNSYKLLKEGKELTDDEVFDASIVGWCVEWFQSGIVMLDDITDNSHTRGGRTCWHRVPKVGNIAVNDCVLLMAHIPRILKKHLREKPYYLDLLGLFNEVTFQVVSGQVLDLISTNGETDLSNYTMDNYRHIAKYKSGYSLYLPAACALVIAGENLENHENIKDVLFEMGIHFQVADDFLDFFSDPEKNGEVGNDIEEFKCSWLIVNALERGNEEQKKILHDHYGKANRSDVAKVKAVYNEIDIHVIFALYETKSYDKIKSLVEAHPNKALQGIWTTFNSCRQFYKNKILKGLM